MESGSTAIKVYHVVLQGVRSAPGKGVLEFYLKTAGSVRKRFNTNNRMPSHRIKLDADSCLLSAQPSAGRIQIVHLAKKTCTLLSKHAQTLEAWAAALSDQIGRDPAALEREASIQAAPRPLAAPAPAEAKEAAIQMAATEAAVRKVVEEAEEATAKTGGAVRDGDLAAAASSSGEQFPFEAPPRITQAMGEAHRCRMRSFVTGIKNEFYPQVFITYATGNRPGVDFEGCGPGMHYARAVAERLEAQRIKCFSGERTSPPLAPGR